jgi:hypothetical protein
VQPACELRHVIQVGAAVGIHYDYLEPTGWVCLRQDLLEPSERLTSRNTSESHDEQNTEFDGAQQGTIRGGKKSYSPGMRCR